MMVKFKLLLTALGLGIFNTQAQTLNVHSDNGIDVFGMLLPVVYRSAECEVEVFAYVNGNLQSVIFDEFYDCSNINYFAVVDSFKYPFTFNLEFSISNNYALTNTPLQIGNCSRLSGGAVSYDSNAYTLYLNSKVFSLAYNSNIKRKIISDTEIHFVFNTIDGDAYCVGGIPSDLIFKGGFE